MMLAAFMACLLLFAVSCSGSITHSYMPMSLEAKSESLRTIVNDLTESSAASRENLKESRVASHTIFLSHMDTGAEEVRLGDVRILAPSTAQFVTHSPTRIDSLQDFIRSHLWGLQVRLLSNDAMLTSKTTLLLAMEKAIRASPAQKFSSMVMVGSAMNQEIRAAKMGLAIAGCTFTTESAIEGDFASPDFEASQRRFVDVPNRPFGMMCVDSGGKKFHALDEVTDEELEEEPENQVGLLSRSNEETAPTAKGLIPKGPCPQCVVL